MKYGFLKVACGTPRVSLANPAANAEACFTLMREAYRAGARVCALPELCLTGYTCGDLFLQPTLLRGAEEALATVVAATRDLDMITAIGLPVVHGGKCYNCAAVVHKGQILGVVPKTHVPNYGEFQELRWFSPAPAEGDYITLCGQNNIFFGTNQTFSCATMPELVVGVEMCEDLWNVCPPSIALAQAGATVILNLSASNETVGKAAPRRARVRHQSAALACGYLYASAGDGESTTDLVFTGHNIIAELGDILAERQVHAGLILSELDLGRITYERRRQNTFPATRNPAVCTGFSLEPATTSLTRHISPTPFVPEDEGERQDRSEETIMLSALGLKRRLEHTGAKRAVIGLSGGLDSTLAILIACVAMKLAGRPPADVLAVTMPCFGTTERTRDNAVELAALLGCELRRIDLTDSVKLHLRDIGHDGTPDVTYENAQARERTQVLMDLANMEGGLVVGTGDLSELALGWSTYNGDHMSMYAVNAGIPKTLVRHLVSFMSADRDDLRDVLTDILDTPVSPELLPAVQGAITQKTEDLVGPYELHDFFLYHAIRWGASPAKVLMMAEHAFCGVYDRPVILKWLRFFYRRFFSQQFKRSCMPDGPKVGPVSLSPRGDWRMPSDAQGALWLAELEGL